MIAHDWPSAIAYANEIQAARVLIVCHAADRYRWLERWPDKSTMLQYLPAHVRPCRYAIASTRLCVSLPDAGVVTVTPELVRRYAVRSVLDRIPFDLVIVDVERSFPRSENWKRVLPIVPQLEAAA